MKRLRVQFYVIRNNEINVDGGSAIMEEGQPIRFEGMSEKEIKFLKRGISPTGLASDALYPKDGKKYLEALAYAFSGTYFRASRIIEEDVTE